MISYIKGLITYKNPAHVIVETGGIGYLIHVSLYTYTQIEKSEQVKLLTHFVVKEDSQTLYGFADDEERGLFRNLISVQGVGTSTARLLLSSMNPEEARAAIVGEDLNAFKQVKGIGPKTARRLIVELKDKLIKEGVAPTTSVVGGGNTTRDEALSALMALGFNKVAVQKTLNKVIQSGAPVSGVQDLIKLSLRELS